MTREEWDAKRSALGRAMWPRADALSSPPADFDRFALDRLMVHLHGERPAEPFDRRVRGFARVWLSSLDPGLYEAPFEVVVALDDRPRRMSVDAARELATAMLAACEAATS